MKDILTITILTIVIGFFLFISIKEIVSYIYQFRKCPKCDSSFFNVTKTNTDVLGIDFLDSDKQNIRHFFTCKKCNHHWTVDSYNDMGGSD